MNEEKQESTVLVEQFLCALRFTCRNPEVKEESQPNNQSEEKKEDAEKIFQESNAKIETTIRKIKEVQAETEHTRNVRQDLRDFQRQVEDALRAEMEHKIARCREKKPEETRTDRQMARMIKNIDKHRAKYYEFFTAHRWGNKRLYDICINTSKLGIEKVGDFIIEYVNVLESK